jgi:uncharacterized protein (DUF1684 family)
MGAQLEVADWRRAVSELYAAVRASSDPERAHEEWRERRNVLFTTHPQSPLLPDDPLRTAGLSYFPYDPALRFTVKVEPDDGPERVVSSATDGDIRMRRVGTIALPDPVAVTLDVWWLAQYGGGIFVPLRDGTAGTESYGGGRYLLDTVKGADLGGDADALVVDLNFLYHSSCRYNPAWECPLAPERNTTDKPVHAGERL